MADQENQVQEQAAPPKPTMCPCCGHDGSQIVRPSPSDQQEYIRCLLAGRPFRKVYQLYNGQLKLAFETASATQSEQLSGLLMEIRQQRFGDGEVTQLQDAQFTGLVLALRMLCSLRSVNGKELTPLSLNSSAELMDAYKERLGGKDEGLLTLMIQVHLGFTKLCSLLMASGRDDSFWKGAGYV